MTTANTHFEFREMTWTLYSALSSRPGQRNWDAVRQHYHPEARLVRTGIDPDGTRFAKVMTLDAYIENVEALLKEDHFIETELSHEAVVFGNVARLTSVYESTWHTATGIRRGRGVNFFTIVRDDNGWRIISNVWDLERDGLLLPRSLTQGLNSRTI